jgi:hypothetical protein
MTSPREEAPAIGRIVAGLPPSALEILQSRLRPSDALGERSATRTRTPQSPLPPRSCPDPRLRSKPQDGTRTTNDQRRGAKEAPGDLARSRGLRSLVRCDPPVTRTHGRGAFLFCP